MECNLSHHTFIYAGIRSLPLFLAISSFGIPFVPTLIRLTHYTHISHFHMGTQRIMDHSLFGQNSLVLLFSLLSTLLTNQIVYISSLCLPMDASISHNDVFPAYTTASLKTF